MEGPRGERLLAGGGTLCRVPRWHRASRGEEAGVLGQVSLPLLVISPTPMIIH